MTIVVEIQSSTPQMPVSSSFDAESQHRSKGKAIGLCISISHVGWLLAHRCRNLQPRLGSHYDCPAESTFRPDGCRTDQLSRDMAVRRHDRWCLWNWVPDRWLGLPNPLAIVFVGLRGKIFGPIGFCRFSTRDISAALRCDNFDQRSLVMDTFWFDPVGCSKPQAEVVSLSVC